ncbi:helix-turn-helix transcriptional regulator [Pseudoxanthomonas mexicana]
MEDAMTAADIATIPPMVLLTKRQVCARTGLSKSTLYRHIKQGYLPAPIQIGPRSPRWVEDELVAALRRQVTARDATKT